MSSQCNDLVFVVVVRRLFVFSDEQSIHDQRQEVKSMIISMMQNYNNWYSNHNNNIKYVDSTIKCIGFQLFDYTISLNVVSSFVVFSDFDYMFLLIH